MAVAASFPKHRHILTALAIAASAASASTADNVPVRYEFANPQRRAQLMSALPNSEAAVRKRMQDDGIAGLAYGVVIDGELVAVQDSACVTSRGARRSMPTRCFRSHR
jgi:hypothetical protein